MTPAQARDELGALLDGYWKENAGAAIGTPGFTPELLWDGVARNAAPAQSSSFARVTMLHAATPRVTLADGSGSRRFTRVGTVFVQCFAPRGERGLTLAEALATVARDALEGKRSPGGMWFRAGTIKEVGPDKGWFQVNAVVPFEYDETK